MAWCFLQRHSRRSGLVRETVYAHSLWSGTWPCSAGFGFAADISGDAKTDPDGIVHTSANSASRGKRVTAEQIPATTALGQVHHKRRHLCRFRLKIWNRLSARSAVETGRSPGTATGRLAIMWFRAKLLSDSCRTGTLLPARAGVQVSRRFAGNRLHEAKPWLSEGSWAEPP